MLDGPKTIEGVGLYLKALCFAVGLLGLGTWILLERTGEQSRSITRVETQLTANEKTLDRIDRNLEAVRASIDDVRAHQDRANADHGVIKTALKADSKKAESSRPTPTAFEGYYGAVVKDAATMEAILEKAKASPKPEQPSESKVIWVYTDDPKLADFLMKDLNPKVIPAPKK